MKTVDEKKQLIADLRKRSFENEAEQAAIYNGTGIYYTGICTVSSKLSVNDKDPESMSVIEEAEFKSADGETLFFNKWHDLSKDEMPFDFEEGKKYRFQLKNLSGGWSNDLKKRQFKVTNISNVSLVQQKVIQKGKVAAA